VVRGHGSDFGSFSFLAGLLIFLGYLQIVPFRGLTTAYVEGCACGQRSFDAPAEDAVHEFALPAIGMH
jgi:hypothetical protein